MKVLLLAAGRSKRMQPIKDKNFLKFFGKPLIQYQLEMIKKAGFKDKDVIIVGGHHNLKPIGDVLAEMKMKGAAIVEQKKLELGMCGAVLAARKQIGSEPVLIVSSNDAVELNAFKLIKKAGESKLADSYVLGKKVKKYFPGGYLKTDNNGFIKGVVEKPKLGTEPSDLVNIVMHVHRNPEKLFKYLEKAKSKEDDLYEVALDNMIKDGVKVKAVKYEGFWQPIKYPWHVIKVFKQAFEVLFKTKKPAISKKAKVSKNAFISGPVIIEDGVKIFDGACITGPVYIGKNSVIATHALVRESHVGENCVIGFGTEVARSFLGNEVWTHTNYIGDSVIGSNVSFGAGAVTGNLRFDEKNIYVDFEGNKVDTETNKFGVIMGDNVRVGINASIMPGTKVGNGSFVGPDIIVSENVPDDSFIRGIFEVKISKNKDDAAKIDREEMKKKL
jgi:bifunctional UDP-N-acetylglucosamine pyrophosphorylase/glucosamine-1-phosphate N-acetyltransferase